MAHPPTTQACEETEMKEDEMARAEDARGSVGETAADTSLTALLRDIKQTLCVPAAEYVPAMGDAMLLLDRAIQLSYQTDPKWNPEPSPKVAAGMGKSLLREATAAPLPPRELPKLRPVWRFPDGSTKELTGEEWAEAKAAWGRPVAKAEGADAGLPRAEGEAVT